MKTITFLITLFILSFFVSCSVDQNDAFDESVLEANFRTTQSIKNYAISSENERSLEDICYQTRLIAGQHHDAGVVSVAKNGNDFIITYQTYEGWFIDATHLSIGNCDDTSIPTTGSGNPKVGKFEHSTSNSEATTLVTYTFNIDILEEEFCFAAHAEVTGPTGGETAWAEGTDFEGNNWAMFVEALLSGCTNEPGDENGPGPVLL